MAAWFWFIQLLVASSLCFTKVASRSTNCNLKATKDSLEFLAVDQEELYNNVSVRHFNLFHNDKDCSMRLTDLKKLRNWLNETSSNFSTSPASLVFVNNQDEVLKLNCTGGKDYNKEYYWTLKADDEKKHIKEMVKKFNEDYKDAESGVLNIPNPRGAPDLRTFTCKRRKKGQECSHTFYVIKRPTVKITFPLQVLADGKIDFTCEHKQGKNDASWMVRVPEKVVKNYEEAKEPYTCKYEELVDGKKPVYFNGPNTTRKAKLEGVQITGGKKKIDVKIKKAEEKHRGIYECIWIDGRGVPSTPHIGSIRDTRYHGRGKLHVRALMYIIIPCVLIFAIFLIMAIIWLIFRKSDSMENPDGTKIQVDAVANKPDEGAL